MPNSNYRRGRILEYEIKKLLEGDGYAVARTAGSHGPWDIVATKENQQGEVRELWIILVQCKRRKRG